MSKQIKKTEIAEEGVLDNLLKPLKELLDVINKADTKLKGFADDIDGSFTFKEDSKGLRELEVNLKKTNKLAEQKKKVQQDQTKIEKQLADAKGRLNKLSVQEERLLKARLQTDQQSIKVQDQKTKQLITEERLKQAQLRTDKQIQAEKEKEARQNAKLAKQKADENNAYKQLSKASRDYKNESKRLGAELLKLEQAGNKNTKEFKELSNQYKSVTAQARTTDAQLKKLDATVGDNQRNVGNYKNATSKLTGALGQLGLAVGVGAVAKGIFDFNKNLSRATNQAQTLFQVSEEGAKQIAKDATIIAKAYDKDVNEVLKAGNVLQRQFGVSSDQAFDILNKGFEKGADVSGELLENVNEYSTQLRLAGLNAEQSISIITQSQQAGVFSDKGIDAIKEATLSLREMTPPAQEALEAIGMSADQVQRDIASGSKTYFDVIQEISARTNDVGENTQAAGMILADVFKGAGEDAGDFIFSLGEMNTELNDLEDTNKGVEGAIQNLTKKFYELVFGVNDSLNATGLFSGAINFLADNLGTIIGLIPRLLAYWVIYANRVRIVQAEQFILNGGLKNMIKSIPSAIRGIKGMSLSLRGMGTAMKSIPIVTIIGGLIELISWLSSSTDAVDTKKDAEKAHNDEIERGNKLRAERNQIGKDIDVQFEAREKLSQAELKSLRDNLQAQIRIAEKNEVLVKTRERREEEATKRRLKRQRQELKSLKEFNLEEGETIEDRKRLIRSIELDLGRETVFINRRIEERNKDIRSQEEESALLEKRQKQLQLILPLIKKDTRERSSSAEATKKQNKAVEEEIDLWQEYLDQIKKVREEQDLMSIDTDAIEADELSGDIPSLIEPMNKELDALEKGYTEQETALINSLRKREISQEQFDRKMMQLKLERLQKERQVMLEHGADVTQIDKQIAQAMLNQTGDTLKATVQQVGNAIADIYSDIFQRQIDELKKQEDTAKQVYGTLEKLASEGNIAAQQSLAEQIQAQQEAQREQIRLQQKQANIEKARQVYAIIQSQLDEGKSASEAIASTGGFMTAIQGLIQSLPSFYEGTEDTGKAGKALDNKGGRLAVLHNNERVLTADQNKHLQGIPNPMIPVLVNKALDSAGNSYDLLAIDELRRTRQAIEKLPQSTYQLESAMGQIVKMVATHKTGNSTTKNTYK